MAFYDQHVYDEYSSSKNHFATASIVLSAIAIITFSSILPAIFTGSLSIIFAILSRKGTGRLHPLAKMGAILSTISVTLCIAVFSFFYSNMPKMLQNETYRNELKYTIEAMYGNEIDADSLLDAIENGNIFSPTGVK